jgi:hypothetical protein
VSLFVQPSARTFLSIVVGESGLCFGRVNQLPLTKEIPDGNCIDRYFSSLFAGWWWLGIFPLAQKLISPRCTTLF